jgi:hypothetical protein
MLRQPASSLRAAIAMLRDGYCGLSPWLSGLEPRSPLLVNPVVSTQLCEWPLSLRVIRCLPVTWRCGALRGQASDKPRGRKPRAGMGTVVVRAGAMGI